MQIKMYVTPVCPHCIQARKFFNEHKIKWEEIDVTKDGKALDLLFKKTGMVVGPTFEINGKFFVGFDLHVKKMLVKELKLGV